VTYEDGYVHTVPIRYGVDLLEWSWGREREDGVVCYRGDPVDCAPEGAPSVTFFATEWINPRYGKAVAGVRLHGSRDFRDAHGKPMAGNGIALAALSVVEPWPAPRPESEEDEF